MATSVFGNTNQGQQTQGFMDILKSITGGAGQISPQLAQGGQQAVQSTQLGMTTAYPGAIQSAQNTLSTEAGIPQLQSQYGDLAKLFQLYLADGNLASKYSNPTNTNPYANPALAAGTPGTTPISGQVGESPVSATTGAPNPYLASPEALASAATPSGSGFTVPGLTTSAMNAPVSASSNLMNLINSAIGIENQAVTSKVGDVSKNWQSAMNSLGVLANAFSSAYTQAQSRADKAGDIPGTKQNTGAVFNQIIDNLQKVKGAAATETDVWNYINQHDSALRAQGVDVDGLWKLHTDLAGKVNKEQGLTSGGLLEGGKPISQKEADKLSAKVGSIKAFGDLVNSYYNGTKEIASGLRMIAGVDQMKEWASQKDLYLGAVSKQLGISRSNVRFEDLKKKMPGDIIGIGAEGSFRGHLTTLLSISDLMIVASKQANPDGSHPTQVIPRTSFNKDTQIEIKPTDQSIPFDEIKQILGGIQ